ncbi:hypothetical protein [Cytobacillus gottheilii]|uniref:hypothetical protein n=1 Tax=Cytobacillus gottheilii TaxID=859144 RepID=UPI0009BC5B11|nr:hypothetical protein [Cytobacillus gottheilii]
MNKKGCFSQTLLLLLRNSVNHLYGIYFWVGKQHGPAGSKSLHSEQEWSRTLLLQSAVIVQNARLKWDDSSNKISKKRHVKNRQLTQNVYEGSVYVKGFFTLSEVIKYEYNGIMQTIQMAFQNMVYI